MFQVKIEKLYRVLTDCRETSGGVVRTDRGACNEFFDGFNAGTWDSADGFATTSGPVPSDPMAPVPLPAGLPLLIAGLAGLAVVRRQKKPFQKV